LVLYAERGEAEGEDAQAEGSAKAAAKRWPCWLRRSQQSSEQARRPQACSTGVDQRADRREARLQRAQPAHRYLAVAVGGGVSSDGRRDLPVARRPKAGRAQPAGRRGRPHDLRQELLCAGRGEAEGEDAQAEGSAKAAAKRWPCWLRRSQQSSEQAR
jgi:hypothetical protein